MSRIAKTDVNAALALAAQHITDAGGRDKITSRKDMEQKLTTLSGTEKALTDRFYRFIDHRDFKTNARVTAKDVERALAYAKEKLIEKYDVNQNGLSKAEVEKMSLTGQLAVKLAAELKGINAPLPSSSSALAGLVATAARDTTYISETDSAPAFIEASLPRGAAVDAASVYRAFAAQIAAGFDEQDGDLSAYTYGAQAPTLLKDIATRYSDPTLDPSYGQSAKGFERLAKVFADNLKDVVALKIGPKDSQSGALADSQGAYQYLVVGKAADGKLAGVMFESVET
jgi:hypothetical protein